MKTAGVIGAGIGGISAAIHLAIAGYDVTVFEKNSKPGGKASEIREEGFRFDTGPSLLTMTDVIESLFKKAGEDIGDYLEIKKLDTLCRYFYKDGTILNMYSDFVKAAAEIENKTTTTHEELSKYFSYSKKIFELTKNIFLYDTYKGIKSLFKPEYFKTLLKIGEIDSGRTMHEANVSFFKDEKMIQIFDRYATYNGSNPYKAPATLNLISHVENNLGGYYITGGMYELVNALYKLAVNKGVKFMFDTYVKGAGIDGNYITSLITSEKSYSFDYYVSNLDALTFNTLFGKGNMHGIKDELLSTSAIVFYWGMRGNYEQLETHNILFSGDYKTEFEHLSGKREPAEEVTVYVYISSKFAKSDAPEGCENWFVMINTPPDFGQDWKTIERKYRDIIISKIESALKTEIRGKIMFEKTLTPDLIKEYTGSYKGSLYGLSSNTKFSAFKRQPNKSKKYKNLYYCGGSAHPGGGIPLVMLSGKNAAELIKDS